MQLSLTTNYDLNIVFVCVCLQNIIILVLFIFIVNFHFEQKSFKNSRPFCNYSGLLAKITMPSVYNSKNILNISISMPSIPEFMNCSSISFKFRENNIGDKHSPA